MEFSEQVCFNKSDIAYRCKACGYFEIVDDNGKVVVSGPLGMQALAPVFASSSGTVAATIAVEPSKLGLA